MNTTPPAYNAIYFDSNELLANGWPEPSVKLSNFLYIASSWNLQCFIPYPVIDETEAHWRRTVETSISKLNSARKDLERMARPVTSSVVVSHSAIERMILQYEATRETALNQHRIHTIPYSKRGVHFFFKRATRYVMPFEKDREGKGFQDAVILQSVLDHLRSVKDLNGLIITMDGGMKQAQIKEFLPRFDTSRLRFNTLDEALHDLFDFHFDQNVVKPWAEERKNALEAAEALEGLWKQFLSSNLTEPMLRAGEFGQPLTVIGILSVDSVKVAFVDTPIPTLDIDPNRPVKILVNASAGCTVIARKERFNFFSSILGGAEYSDSQPAPPAEILQANASWSGGIRATADVVSREFRNIVPESIVSEEELRSRN